MANIIINTPSVTNATLSSYKIPLASYMNGSDAVLKQIIINVSGVGHGTTGCVLIPNSNGEDNGKTRVDWNYTSTTNKIIVNVPPNIGENITGSGELSFIVYYDGGSGFNVSSIELDITNTSAVTTTLTTSPVVTTTHTTVTTEEFILDYEYGRNFSTFEATSLILLSLLLVVNIINLFRRF